MSARRLVLTDDLLREAMLELAAGPHADDLVDDVMRLIETTLRPQALGWPPRLGRSQTILVAAALVLTALVAGLALGMGAIRLPSLNPSPGVPLPSQAPGELRVRGSSNIYGAGHAAPPAPAGHGAGQLPPVWDLTPGTQVVTFTAIAGQVTHSGGSEHPLHGAAGDLFGITRMEPYDGISGIVHEHNAMFLVGVFLTDAEPSDPPPATLDFTDADAFAELAPEVGQLFLIGDGSGQRYVVPDGATRLFLGFADGWFTSGPPGYYGDNRGVLSVTIEEAVE